MEEKSTSKKSTGKTWLWIGGGLAALVALGQLGDNTPPVVDGQKGTGVSVERKVDPATQLNEMISSVKEFKSGSYDSYDQMVIQMAIFKAWANTVRQSDTIPSLKKKSAELRALVGKIQAKEFPIMRSTYVKIVKDKMWEENIKVSKQGPSTIQFVGGPFANNKSIKQFQEAASEQLNLLRFKQARYKWIDAEDEYTYYDLKPPVDKALMD